MKQLLFLVFMTVACTKVIAQTPENNLIVYSDSGKVTINKNIYGQFTEHLGNCIYGGIWVGENSPIPNTRGIRNDVIEALKELSVPVIRWPGGCFADTYHWKDGIGPKEKRQGIINKTWGGLLEDNSFGTHEFLDFCELIGAEPYLAVNVGSGTVQEASGWVDYVNSEIGPMADLRRQNGRENPWHVKYWGIGNESWGCGGNMTAAYYSDLYKKFATFCSGEYKILSGGINDDLHWTETVMKNTQNYKQLIQGYSYHYYTICNNWEKKGSAIRFNNHEWFSTMQKTWWVNENLNQHIRIMDKYDPENKIALIADEWGNWFDVEPGTNPGFLFQQNTLRDAVTAGLYLNIFNNHADRVKMANIAQMVNVLQSLLLTRNEALVKTPTYYVFKLFKVHQNATLLPIELQCSNYINGTDTIPALSVSASRDKDGRMHISVINLDPEHQQNLKCELKGVQSKNVTCQIITAAEMNAYNDFNSDEKVNIQTFNNFSVKKGKLEVVLPAKSVVMLELKE